MKTFEVWADEMLTSIQHKGYRLPAVRKSLDTEAWKEGKRPLGVPGRGQHNALATLNEIIAGEKVGWVFEADLKNFFGSLDHEWMMKFLEHRNGDPRILRLIQRWLKVGVLDCGLRRL
ncbi:hypothetical protein D3C76_296200 [compost metagenome]